MKKSELVDMFIELHAEPNKANYNRGLISRCIGMALNDIFFKLFSKDPSNLSDYLKPFSLVPVKHDENISIITIPVSTLQFSDVGDMVRLSYQSDNNVSFVPIREGEIGLIDDLRNLDNVIPFVLKGSKIWVYGLSSVMPVLVECLVAFHELSDDEDVKIPAGSDLVFFQTAREMLNLGSKN